MTTNRLLLPSRLPHAGEIRGGEKRAGRNGKTYPARLDTWRLTGSEQVIRAAAAAYGGEITPWEDASYPDAWQVTTETRDLHVLIPFGTAVNTDPRVWEQWTKGGRSHACDGITCTRTEVTGEGKDRQTYITTEPCSCDPEEPTCKPTTVLRVILPLLPGVGAWRLVTHSVHAAMELRTTVDMLHGAGAPNPCPAYLTMQQRRGTDGQGGTRVFPVPVLQAQWSPAAALGAGAFPDQRWISAATTIAELHAPPARAELGTGSPTGEAGEGSTTGPSPTVDRNPDPRMAAHQDGLHAILADTDQWTLEELQAAWEGCGSPWCDTTEGMDQVRDRLRLNRANRAGQ